MATVTCDITGKVGVTWCHSLHVWALMPFRKHVLEKKRKNTEWVRPCRAPASRGKAVEFIKRLFAVLHS